MAETIFPFVALAIPIIAILAGLLKRWIAFKERQLEVASAQTAEKAAQYAARAERLEQRVAVLERIVTDRGFGLDTEIERLRAAPLN